MVSPPRADSSLARPSRPVRGVGLRDHAPADARRGGHPVFRRVDGSLPVRAGIGGSLRAICAKSLGGTRLLLPRPQFAQGREDSRGRIGWQAAAFRGRAPQTARHRTLHRGRHRFDGLRSRRTHAGWQPAPRLRPPLQCGGSRRFHRGREITLVHCRGKFAKREGGRFQPGADGFGRGHLPAEESALPALSVARGLSGAETGIAGSASGVTTQSGGAACCPRRGCYRGADW